MSSHISRLLEWDRPQQMAEIVQRRMSEHMSQRIVQEHVRVGTLDAVRDWKTWLSNYDDVAEKRGIENIQQVHWFCFLRRKDLPLEFAGQVARSAPGSPAANPNDVMLMCKQFMSDPMLLQPPMVMAHAGACGFLPPNGPNTWEMRHEIDTQGINRL